MPTFNDYQELFKQHEISLLEYEISSILSDNETLLKPYEGLLQYINNEQSNDDNLLSLKEDLFRSISGIKTVSDNLTTLTKYENIPEISQKIQQLRSDCYKKMILNNVSEYMQNTDKCIRNCDFFVNVTSLISKNVKLLQPYQGVLQDINEQKKGDDLSTLASLLNDVIACIKIIDANLTELKQYEQIAQVSQQIQQIRYECQNTMKISSTSDYKNKTNQCVTNCPKIVTIVNEINKLKNLRLYNVNILSKFEGIIKQIDDTIYQATQEINQADITKANSNLDFISNILNDTVDLTTENQQQLYQINDYFPLLVKRWFYEENINSKIGQILDLANNMTLEEVSTSKVDIDNLVNRLKQINSERSKKIWKRVGIAAVVIILIVLIANFWEQILTILISLVVLIIIGAVIFARSDD